MKRLRLLLLVLAVLACAPVRADEALWALLRGGGQVVLIRHAVTDPGVGDPPGMTLDDCSSQRQLSAEGRRDAQRLGDALRSRGVAVAGLQSSPWCRCIDTARIAFGRAPEINAALGNLFGRPENEARQLAQLRPLVSRRPSGGNLFLVTHGSTTLALTGVSPATAEMVVLTPHGDGFQVAGRLALR